MLVQFQVQPNTHCSGHPCTLGRKLRQEETHQEILRTREAAASVNGVIQAEIHQEEALDQEEAPDQEEQNHLHQEEDQEEEACRQEELHHSSQEEDQAIQALLHRHLQVLHSLYAHQIHGAHSIGPEN